MDRGYDITAGAKPTECADCGSPLVPPYCPHIRAGVIAVQQAPVVWFTSDSAGRQMFNAVPAGGAR